MKFVIRDDDLNYFSKPSDIAEWYKDIFAQGIPVGFAVIPFVKPTSDVYPFYPKNSHTPTAIEHREYPVGDNTELIEYIKSNPLIEVLQHGCTHETKNGIYEYQQKTGLIKDTLRGNEELVRVFGKSIFGFAAPHDWIGTNGVLGIEAAKMNIIRGRGVGLRNWILRWQYIEIFFRMLVYRFPKYISFNPPVYPYVLDFGKHKEVTSYRLEDPDVFEGLKHVHQNNGVFVVVAHVHSLNEEKKERLASLIKKACEYDAEFVAPSAVFI